jgi:hypothetical protein
MTKRLLLLLIVFATCATMFAKNESLEQLKARVASASAQDQPKIYVRIAELELDNLNAAFNGGDAQKGQTALQDLTSACLSAAQTSVTTRKHMKQTEIALRKVSDRLDQIRKGVEFESRPPFEAANSRIEQARTELLNAMFKK